MRFGYQLSLISKARNSINSNNLKKIYVHLSTRKEQNDTKPSEQTICKESFALVEEGPSARDLELATWRPLACWYCHLLVFIRMGVRLAFCEHTLDTLAFRSMLSDLQSVTLAIILFCSWFPWFHFSSGEQREFFVTKLPHFDVFAQLCSDTNTHKQT